MIQPPIFPVRWVHLSGIGSSRLAGGTDTQADPDDLLYTRPRISADGGSLAGNVAQAGRRGAEIPPFSGLGDRVIVRAAEPHQAEAVAKRIGHRRQFIDLVAHNRALQRRAGRLGTRDRSLQILDH